MAGSDVKLRVEILADGRTVVRAFDQTAQASKRAGEQIQRDSKKSKDSLEIVGETAHRTRGAIGMLAGTFGLGGLAFGVADLVKRGMAWQSQQAGLQQALKNTGQASQASMESLSRSTEALSTRGGFASPEALQGLTQLLVATQSAAKAQKDLALATNVARGSHKDLLAVTKAVSMAEQGRMTGLTRLGIAVAKHATAQQALATLQQRYAGQTAAFSRTTAGAISNAQNALEGATARIGAAILPAVAQVAGAVANLVDYLGSHKDALIAFGAALGTIFGAFLFTQAVQGVQALGLALTAFAGEEAGAGVAAVAMGTAMRATIIGIVITALYLLVTNFKQVKAVAVDVWNTIMRGARSVGRFLVGVGSTIWHALAWPFQRAGKAISVVFNGILSAARWTVKHVKEAMNTLGFSGNGVASYINPIGLAGHIGGALSSLLPHTGGLVPAHMAMGGGVGPSGTDTMPAWLTPGEYVLRRQAVQQLGTETLNSINATGSLNGAGGQPDQVYVTVPLRIIAGGRVLAEQTVHTVARRTALAGSTGVVG